MTSDLQPRYPVALYYDGACRLCAGEMRNLMTRNTEGKLRFTDCSPADFSAGPAPRAELMRQMHAQDADGTVFTGVAALRVAYDAVGLGAALDYVNAIGIERSPKRAEKARELVLIRENKKWNFQK